MMKWTMEVVARGEKEAGNKRGFLWGRRGGKDCHQEPPQWFEDILLLLSQAITQEPSPVKPYVTQRKPPTPLKMRRKDLFGGQNLPAFVRQGRSFYLMLWLVEHSWRVAVLTMNSFWGFQMPQLCFSVFNHLQKLFIALYTSSIMSIIL